MSSICAFPGCTLPTAPPSTAGGRPPKYCELPEHNRTTAFRAKQAAAAAEADQAGERAVSLSSARLRLVIESMAPMLAGHRSAVAAQVAAALESLDDIGDPAMVEAEIGAVRAEALRQASEAEADAEMARQQAADAVAAGERAQAEQVEAVTAAQAEQAAAVEAAVAAEDRAVQAEAGERAAQEEAAEHAAASAAARAEVETAVARAEAAEAQRDAETARANSAVGERDAANSRAAQAESALTTAQQELQESRKAALDGVAAAAAAQARADAAEQSVEQARQEARRIEEREVARADREIERVQSIGRDRIAELEAELAKLRTQPVRRTRGSKDAG